ncbi:MAG: NfeD family protein [Desulfosporosinus sp.]|jgi:membrane-bound ClpP family serine protease
MSQTIIILLILIGIFLLALELFVIPGFGISGILGIAALVTGIFLVTDSLLEGVFYTGGALIVLGLIAYWSYRSPRTRKLWQKFSLSTRQTSDAGYVGPKVQAEKYIGRTGISLTQLRPSGTGNFDGEYLDVVTEGGYISQGTKIKVIAVEGTRIVVREVNNKEVKLGK